MDYVAQIQSDYPSPYHLVALVAFQGRDQKAQEISKTSLHHLSGFADNYIKPKKGEKNILTSNYKSTPIEMNTLLYRLQSKKTKENFGYSESVLSKPTCIQASCTHENSQEIKTQCVRVCV